MAHEVKSTILVKGNDWTVYLTGPEDYAKINGEDSAAMTWTTQRQIYFRTDEINIDVVRHELFHAYFAESHIESANLTAIQAEEVGCSIFGEYGETIVKQARELKKELSAAAKDIVNHNRKNRKNDKKSKTKVNTKKKKK
jgi:hypothetical protein